MLHRLVDDHWWDIAETLADMNVKKFFDAQKDLKGLANAVVATGGVMAMVDDLTGSKRVNHE